MPIVSEARKNQQRAHILASAERCFARGGFHATSMDEIIAEAAMSSSTVYRYFPEGKQELIRAISVSRIGALVDRASEVMAADMLPSPGELIETCVQWLWHEGAGATAQNASTADDSARLAINGWAELPRDSELRSLVEDNYRRLHRSIQALAERWIAEGTITNQLSPEDVASLIQNAVFGLIAEQAITSASDPTAAGQRIDLLLRAGNHAEL